MTWLVITGRAAVSSLTSAALILFTSSALTDPAAASPAVAQPQLSYTCRFNDGPRAGQSQTYPDMSDIEQMPIGAPCTDGRGDTGVAVPDPFVQTVPAQPSPAPARPMSSTCQFNDGPRGGQTQSYAGVTGMQPMAIGTQCTDGQGSSGLAILEASAEAPASAQPSPTPVRPMSSTCQFNAGPRAGQTQSYAGVTGMQPMAIGAQCTDGQGSSGVAILEASVQPAAAVQPSLAPAHPTSSTCQFNDGPRAGQSESYAGVTGMQPLAIGAQCTDGRGSSGVAIVEASVEPTAPEQPSASPAHPTSSTCQFNDGPRDGQSQSYTGVTGMQPVAIGAQCADGQGSSGVAILEASIQPPAAEQQSPEPAPGLSFTCKFKDGPRAGQTQSYADLPGVKAAPIGIQCADRKGNTGVVVGEGASASEKAKGPAAGQSGQHSLKITGAAVGAAVVGLDGAVWADPKNSGYVTGYTYHGQYHRGTPPRYDRVTRAVMTNADAGATPGAVAGALLPGATSPAHAVAGTAVRGLPGAVWIDLNSDGVVDGYVYKGHYYPGLAPASFESATPPAAAARPAANSGE